MRERKREREREREREGKAHLWKVCLFYITDYISELVFISAP